MSKKVHYTKEQVFAFLQAKCPDVDWGPVITQLPMVIWRARWNDLAKEYGLPFTAKHMALMDCQGDGPRHYSREAKNA